MPPKPKSLIKHHDKGAWSGGRSPSLAAHSLSFQRRSCGVVPLAQHVEIMGQLNIALSSDKIVGPNMESTIGLIAELTKFNINISLSTTVKITVLLHGITHCPTSSVFPFIEPYLFEFLKRSCHFTNHVL